MIGGTSRRAGLSIRIGANGALQPPAWGLATDAPPFCQPTRWRQVLANMDAIEDALIKSGGRLSRPAMLAALRAALPAYGGGAGSSPQAAAAEEEKADLVLHIFDADEDGLVTSEEWASRGVAGSRGGQ